MYYPTQIPYILNQEFSRNMKYSETSAEECGGFVICFWDMQPLSGCMFSVENIIAADACIDLIVDYDEKNIGFAGMSRTEFHFRQDLPNRSFGVRMMPGAFHQLTGLPAAAAMDTFLPIESVFTCFDQERFFSLSFAQAKEYVKSFFVRLTENKTPGTFTALFNELSQNMPATVNELCQRIHFGPRQCQRLFAKHYGISPKMALSIVRFQRCMGILTSPESKPADIRNVTGYYDQPHFIKDFKRNIGITPLELIRIYRT